MIGNKIKKPFYKRGWFIILIIIVAILLLTTILGKKKSSSSEKIDWSKMELGEKISMPPSDIGEIWDNTEEELKVNLDEVSDDEYTDYVKACKEMGYTVDAEKQSFSYKAYNSEGYKVDISHISDSMDITLEAPMKFTTINWPTSTVGTLLPVPKSTVGKFSYEHDTSFFVYIGKTSLEDYAKYAQACSDKGFIVDYDKGEKYYRADNADGYHVSVEYEGNDIMSISIDSPDEQEESNPKKKKENTDKKKKATKKKDKVDKNGLRTDFKNAMDSYETFVDEYVSFMKKYEKNPDDISLLGDYAEYVSKYEKFASDFENWESDDLNDAELAYYLDVQDRVSKKLLEVVE